MKNCKWMTLLGATAMVMGCANVDQQRELLDRPGACCTAITDAPATPISSAPQVIRISATDPIGEFPEGKSRFKVLALPANASQSTQVIKLRAMTQFTKVFSGGGSWAPYFHPAVTFLDANRNVVSTVVATEDPPKPDGCGPHFGCAIVEVEAPVPAAARYVVIHQPQKLLGKTRDQIGFGVQREQTLYAAGALIRIGEGAPGRRVIVMAEGDISVSVQ